MAFNREDLITWNELAPSLQTIFKTLQEEVNDSSIKSLKIATLLEQKMEEDQVQQMIASYIDDKVIPTLPTMQQVFKVSDDVADVTRRFQYHLDDTLPHMDTGAYFLIYRSHHGYDEGQWVYTEELPNYFVLECIKSGITSSTKPSFEDE